MKTIKMMSTSEQIEDACDLLYKVYIEKENWEFDPENPSKNKVEVRNGRKLLVDKFVNNSIWFGAYDNDKLVGCIRIQSTDENNLFSFEEYRNSQVVLPYFKDHRDRAIEITKFAFLSEGVTPGVIKKLWLDVFKFCELRGFSIIGCTHNNFLKSFFRRIKFPLLHEHAFKYEESDIMPVNFYFADQDKLEVSKMVQALESLGKNSKKNQKRVFEALEIAAPLLPVPLYWHGRDGVLLGINEHCLKAIGTSRDIIGKTPYEFYPKKIADHIINHHKLVMDSGKILAQEEHIYDITTGRKKYFSSIKSPIYDDDGTVIGIVGTSIDITAEKESERLKAENQKLEIQNQFQYRLIQEQVNFKKIIDQAVHDMRSPLASLAIISNYAKNIPQDFCTVITGASRRISDIANNLLSKYKRKEYLTLSSTSMESKGHFHVLLALYQIVSEKKFEFHEHPIEFKIIHTYAGYCAFLNAEEASFKRMISNLMNNAVDAFENEAGNVQVILDCTETSIQITINDNGKGIAPHVLEKIRNAIPVTEGKSSGHGIGFTQVRETLERNDGSFEITSEEGIGTSISILLPKYQKPQWFAHEIALCKEDTILVLDDDSLIHEAWNIRLKEVAEDLSLHCFHFGEEILDFLDNLSMEQKSKCILLADYELLHQKLNGLEIIERSNIKRSILVTSHYNNAKVIEDLKKTHAKLLPKLFISEIPIALSTWAHPQERSSGLKNFIGSHENKAIFQNSQLP